MFEELDEFVDKNPILGDLKGSGEGVLVVVAGVEVALTPGVANNVRAMAVLVLFGPGMEATGLMSVTLSSELSKKWFGRRMEK